VEAGDGLDAVTGHGEHEQPRRGGDPFGGVDEVAAEGGLGVGAGRPQPHPAVAAVPERGAQEPGDRVDAVVLVRCRRHGQPGVVGEQREQAGEVGGDVRVGEASREVLFGRRPGSRGQAGPAAVESGASTLQGALDRRAAGAEHAGHLVGGEAQHVT
jgi:hypothetical protein